MIVVEGTGQQRRSALAIRKSKNHLRTHTGQELSATQKPRQPTTGLSDFQESSNLWPNEELVTSDICYALMTFTAHEQRLEFPSVL